MSIVSKLRLSSSFTANFISPVYVDGDMGRPVEVACDLAPLAVFNLPEDSLAWNYKGNFLIVSFDTGRVWRYDTSRKRMNVIKAGTQKSTRHGANTDYSCIKINGRMELLHTVIMGCHIGRYLNPDSEMIDHLNHNGTNNSIANLVLLDKTLGGNNSNNNRNKLIHEQRGYHGCYWDKTNRKWHAQITVDSVKYFLGYYHTLRGALAANDLASLFIYGGEHRINHSTARASIASMAKRFKSFGSLVSYLQKIYSKENRKTYPLQLPNTPSPEKQFAIMKVLHERALTKALSRNPVRFQTAQG